MAKAKAVSLLRNRPVTLATVKAENGSIWILKAKLKTYGVKHGLGPKPEYMGFEYEYYLICPAKRVKFTVEDPVIAFQFRYILATGSPHPDQFYPVRTITSKNKAAYEALKLAGGLDLLRQLSIKATPALSYKVLREAHLILKKSMQDDVLDLKDPSSTPIKIAEHANNLANRKAMLSWIKIRMQIQACPNKQVAALALDLLEVEYELLTAYAVSPPASHYINAATLALS